MLSIKISSSNALTASIHIDHTSQILAEHFNGYPVVPSAFTMDAIINHMREYYGYQCKICFEKTAFLVPIIPSMNAISLNLECIENNEEIDRYSYSICFEQSVLSKGIIACHVGG